MASGYTEPFFRNCILLAVTDRAAQTLPALNPILSVNVIMHHVSCRLVSAALCLHRAQSTHCKSETRNARTDSEDLAC